MISALKAWVILMLITAVSAGAASKLTLDVSDVKFGRVPQYSNFFRKIVFRAEGDDTVRITDVNTYCDCLRLPMERKFIPPGDSMIVELVFSSGGNAGKSQWRPHVYNDSKNHTIRFNVFAFPVIEVEGQKKIFVSPHTVNASQFGDKVFREFAIQIVNRTDEHVPLDLRYYDEEYFTIDFPVYVAPLDTAVGKVILNDRGVESEFEKSMTFEFINEDYEKELYSIPVRRRIFKSPPGGQKTDK
ncbi:MAG: DUF1573 domain-containing protein [Candidatus Zixiibacteriota bacterium]|nr:MAG: DUF1573 domain-containing protein [candidate division Zixibacteria bacterium]